MSLDPDLLAILACPDCHAGLVEHPARPGAGGSPPATGGPGEDTELVCSGCGLAYPVREGIPVLLVEESRPTTPGHPERPSEGTGSDEAGGTSQGPQSWQGQDPPDAQGPPDTQGPPQGD